MAQRPKASTKKASTKKASAPEKDSGAPPVIGMATAGPVPDVSFPVHLVHSTNTMNAIKDGEVVQVPRAATADSAADLAGLIKAGYMRP